MTISEYLKNGEHTLRAASVETARLDILILLADELGKDKAWLLAHPEFKLTARQIKLLNTKITQRAAHVPLAYIRGHAEFYGRDFAIDERVLVPRPESESMIELLKDYGANRHDCTVIDVGTGSGCLAITAKCEFPHVDVIATDISSDTLKVATANIAKHKVEITLLQGDLLAPLRDLKLETRDYSILANLPYVPQDYPINKAAGHEPDIALFSDRGGLSHYERLFLQVAKNTTANFVIITESLIEQHATLAKIAEKSGFVLAATNGLAQCFVVNPTS